MKKNLLIKRKFKCFIALLCFLLSPSITRSQEAFGWNLSDDKNFEEVGPCTFNVANPANFKLLRKHNFGICAGAFIGKKYYVYTYKSVGTGSAPLDFGIYDFATGKLEKIADYSAMKMLFYDMTYDYKHKILYALGKQNGQSLLLKIDPTNGQYTLVKKLSQEYFALAADTAGQLYAEDEYGAMAKISATGDEESGIGEAGYFPEKTTQSMAFDHATNKLYWVVPTSREGTQIVPIDVNTGYGDTGVELPNNRQIVGLDFPFSNVDKDAPGEFGNFEITRLSANSLQAKLSIVAPSKTASGGTLAPFVVSIYRNETLINKVENVKPAEVVIYNDKVDGNGLYTYKVIASNPAGQGEEIVKAIYLGEDIPAQVQNIIVESTADKKGCKISWTAPTVGESGGYVPATLKYNVVRMPDNVIIATNTADLSVIDATNPKLGIYQYSIVAIGRGRSKATLSDKVVVGSAHALPYNCKFTDDDMLLWKIYDADADKTTWKRVMTSEGVACSYSSKTSDDWLLSYPIQFVSNNNYKVEILASAYDEENFEKMDILLGKGMAENDLINYTRIGQFIVKNEEGGKAKYVAYYKATADEEKSLAIHKVSDADKFTLTIHEINVSVASEGKLKGMVSYEGKPLENVEVLLENTAFTTHTTVDGQWSIDKVPEGCYKLVAKKVGFATKKQSINVIKDEEYPINIEMSHLKKITANGKVHYNGNALSDAKVTLHEINEDSTFVVYTDEQGKFSTSQVYAGHYNITASCGGLKEMSITMDLDDSHLVVPTFDLKAKPTAPRCVEATMLADNNVKLTWKEAIDIRKESFFKGEGVARIGVFTPTERSVVGTVFRHDMALTKVRWQTDEYHGPHKKVDLVVFALDAEGNPTNKVLYEKTGIVNKDNQWTSFELTEPLCVKNGALVALRYNGYLSVLADAGVNAGLAFEKCTFVICKDYAQGKFEYLDKHDMEKNLLMEIEYGELLPNGTPAKTMQCQNEYQLLRKVANSEKNWEILKNISATNRSYTDNKFTELPMGEYVYGVRSVLNEKEISSEAISNIVANNMKADVEFTLLTNAGEITTIPSIILISDDNEHNEFKAQKNAEGKWFVEQLDKGKYELHAELDGFETILKKVEYASEARKFTEQINFVERLLPAFNLKATKTKVQGERLLTWNTENYIFDDFESYQPFTLEPTTEKQKWMYWDKDEVETVDFTNLTFPHTGEKMSFIVFNPYATTPSIALFDAASMPYSGEQYLASFGNKTQANEDYIFSPILNFDGKANFSCVLRSFTNQLGATTVNVGYTIIDNPKTENDIIWLQQDMKISDKNWQELVVAVPENAKRMVLMNNTVKGYYLLIDNIFVGEESPYADGSVKKPLVDRAKYEVRVDGIKVNSIQKGNNSILLCNLSKGNHIAEVTAVYASGQTETKKLVFEVEDVAGIDNLITDKSHRWFIYPNPVTHIAHIVGDVKAWNLITLNGNCIANGTSSDIDIAQFPAGVYFVKVQGHDNATETIKLIKK